MKTILKSMIAVAATLVFANANCEAQTADVKVNVKNAFVNKNIFIAIGDKRNMKTLMTHAKILLSNTDSVSCEFDNMEVGENNIYVFQDLNDNYTLDMNKQGVPSEPCAAVENIEIKEGENKFDVKLVDFVNKNK